MSVLAKTLPSFNKLSWLDFEKSSFVLQLVIRSGPIFHTTMQRVVGHAVDVRSSAGLAATFCYSVKARDSVAVCYWILPTDLKLCLATLIGVHFELRYQAIPDNLIATLRKFLKSHFKFLFQVPCAKHNKIWNIRKITVILPNNDVKTDCYVGSVERCR